MPIRLTDERWVHISEEPAELVEMRGDVLDVIANADRVYAGTAGEMLALKEAEFGP